jgi:hypothetical protein
MVIFLSFGLVAAGAGSASVAPSSPGVVGIAPDLFLLFF